MAITLPSDVAFKFPRYFLTKAIASSRHNPPTLLKDSPAMMRTGRNAMRSAGIDARNGTPERGKRHCVDLFYPEILAIIWGDGK